MERRAVTPPTAYERRLLRHVTERTAAARAQEAADAVAERMSFSEAVREPVQALLGKNWHQASDDEVARMTRWVEINVAPIGGGAIDAAALRAALAREIMPATGAPGTNPASDGPASPPLKTEAFQLWVKETYPTGIPAGTGAKTLSRAFRAASNIEISERQIQRAFGGK